jgi:PKD repeat protein
MKMNQILYAAVAIALSLGACTSKELPEPTPTSPVFSATGSANGSSFVMEAGKNNYVLNSTFNQNSFGVYEFEGVLTPEGCTNCGGSIRVAIAGNAVSLASAPVYPDLSLHEGNYPIANTAMYSDQPFKLQFIADSYPGAVYQWSFGDGHFSFDPNPTHTYEDDNQYNARLTVTKDGYTSELIQRVKSGSPIPCSVYFNTDYLGNNTWKFTDHNQLHHSDQEDLTWDVDGQAIGQGREITYQFSGNAADVHKVGFRDLDAGQDCPNRFYRLITNVPDSRPCLANFYAAPIPAAETLGTVRITYVAPDGTEYNSENDLNNSQNSYFVVDESTDYSSELNGYPTRKLTIRLKAKVKHQGQGNKIIDLDNVNLTMAFAYPN